MVTYTLFILFVWFGTILMPFWVAGSQTEPIDNRDKIASEQNSKTTHFLRG